VISCHGGLSSRLDAGWIDAPARELGVRVVAADRPGIGRSERQPGRTLLDWPEDVLELVDALGTDRFAVLGWSAGGAYAAACAYRLPERVSGRPAVARAVPAGVVDDYRVMRAPWGFDPASIERPVAIWQGDEDQLVPPQWAQRLAERIPTSDLNLCPNEGHLLSRDRYREILTALDAIQVRPAGERS
jgi:pimeloyl-ACP methyl ester carboxylesterase